MHKNQFGHVFICAGSPTMLGAAALCGLAAMRSGAGLVTLGIPRSLNSIIQKKISPVIMTLPLNETPAQTISRTAFVPLKKFFEKFSAIAIGPGLSRHPSSAQFVLKVIAKITRPLVIDADALNALSRHTGILKKAKGVKILTPHPGEMARLTKLEKKYIEAHRPQVARDFAKKFNCILVLKGHRTVVAGPSGKIYTNSSGNAGMATAGSGDVLTGMIAAFLAQGIEAMTAAKCAVYLHGKAGNFAAKQKTKLAMIASDIIEMIPRAVRAS